MDAGTLGVAISEVCPIVSCSVGKPDDRSTWSYEPQEQATAPQIAAADNVVATIPIDTLNTAVPTGDFIARFTNQEYIALERQRAADISNSKVGYSKNWDILVTDSTIFFGRQKAQTLKQQLVDAGVLTAERASEIFS